MIASYPQLLRAKEAFEDGRSEIAARMVAGHLRAHPGEPRGLALLGAIALKTGAVLQAEAFFRQAIARQGETEELLRQLGACLHQQERIDEALRIFTRIESARPGDDKVLSNIAFIQDKVGREEEAREKWQRLVEQVPDNPTYWINYAHNLRAGGLTTEAIEAYRQAIRLDQERGEAWWGLASIKTHRFTDDDRVAMEAAAEIASDILNLSPLHFALGRAWQTQKDYRKAFAHFSEANRLWAEAINYNPEELTDEIGETSQRMDSDYFASLDRSGDPSDAPIFIVSLPRSGSTLLEQMLGSHADIEALGELSYIPALLRAVMERATQRARVTVPQAIAALTPAQREELGREYLRRASLHRKTSLPRFTDKLPHNWNNVVFIRHILPNARFVDIRRNPIACCFANFSHSFTRAHSSSFALDHIGRAYRDYVRLMDHLDSAAPGMVHHVRYEELIERPEPVLRATLDYLGLPWDESVLRFYESDRNVRTPSAEQVRRPLNREGIGAWKPYHQWLGPLFDALGPLAEPELAAADED